MIYICRDPLEKLLNKMMAEMKARGSADSVVTMVVGEVVNLNRKVVQKGLTLKRDQLSSECLKLKIEEERTLKVVEGKLDSLVEEALGGASNKGSLRQLGTNLLRLRVMMDKQIMSLMMPPVKNEMSVCAIIEQYSEKLALESICSDDDLNEVDFEAPGQDSKCFSTLDFSHNLDQLLEKTEADSDRLLGDLTTNIGDSKQKSQILQELAKLETIHSILEQLLNVQGEHSLQVMFENNFWSMSLFHLNVT